MGHGGILQRLGHGHGGTGVVTHHGQHLHVTGKGGIKGDGQRHHLRVQLEGASSSGSPLASAMLSELKLIETLPDSASVVYGVVGGPIALPQVGVQLAENDPNGKLKTQLLGLPIGTIITDGVHTMRVASSAAFDLSGWDVNKLNLYLQHDCATQFSLQVLASSTETNGSTASTSKRIDVHLLEGRIVATPLAVNPYVSYINHTASQPSSAASALLTASAMRAEAGNAYGLNVPVMGGQANNPTPLDDGLSLEAWMKSLESSVGNAFFAEIERSSQRGRK